MPATAELLVLHFRAEQPMATQAPQMHPQRLFFRGQCFYRGLVPTFLLKEAFLRRQIISRATKLPISIELDHDGASASF